MTTPPPRPDEVSVVSAPLRRSTLRRIEKLRVLLMALSARALDVQAAAQVLDCSVSSARKYLMGLCDATLLVSPFVADGAAAEG